MLLRRSLFYRRGRSGGLLRGHGNAANTKRKQYQHSAQAEKASTGWANMVDTAATVYTKHFVLSPEFGSTLNCTDFG
jgi:hypothetical protein